jgi:hypothetical protein
MKVLLERFGFGRNSTLGELWIDSTLMAFTIEDERRKVKKPGETCIPTGHYKLGLRTEGGMHPKYAKLFPTLHKGMLWLLDVPGFEYVYLHIGNTEADSEGCPLIVTTPVVLPSGEFQGSESKRAYERIYPRIANAIQGSGASITIREREAV